MESVLLAIKIATNHITSAFVDESGVILASASRSQETQHPGPRRAEQDPSSWWEPAVLTCFEISRAHPDLAARVEAIGVTGHMLGAVAIDRDGQALRPALTHDDDRGVEEQRWIDHVIGCDPLYQTTGCLLEPRTTLCKVYWLRRNEPETMKRASWVVQPKDYLVGRLSGNPGTTDYSDASHAMLLDVRKRSYAYDILAELGIPESTLPELHAGTDVIGRLTDDAARVMGLRSGTPIVAGGGDRACAGIAARVTVPGDGNR